MAETIFNAVVGDNTSAITNLQSYKMASYLSAGDQPANLNSFLNGLCYVGTSTLNRPEDYCIITAYQVANYVCQIGHGVTSNNMYYRQGRSDGTNWTAWQELTIKKVTKTFTKTENGKYTISASEISGVPIFCKTSGGWSCSTPAYYNSMYRVIVYDISNGALQLNTATSLTIDVYYK